MPDPFQALKTRWLAQIATLTPRRAIVGLAISLVILSVAAQVLLNPTNYQPGDIRSEGWFVAISTAFLALFGIAGVATAVLALHRRQ